jgi:hypothetical protein
MVRGDMSKAIVTLSPFRHVRRTSMKPAPSICGRSASRLTVTRGRTG